jgi:hypothetical protein
MKRTRRKANYIIDLVLEAVEREHPKLAASMRKKYKGDVDSGADPTILHGKCYWDLEDLVTVELDELLLDSDPVYNSM